MNEMISIKDEMPDPGVLVSVYSQQDDIYGYARWSSKKKFDSTIGKWALDRAQKIEYSPISHWWELPELSDDE